jgi:hypothetical protein
VVGVFLILRYPTLSGQIRRVNVGRNEGRVVARLFVLGVVGRVFWALSTATGREVHRLSAKQVDNATRPGYYCDGGGLYLQVSRSLTKSWVFRYTRSGKTREMGLGPARSVGLAKARTRAQEARAQILSPRAVFSRLARSKPFGPGMAMSRMSASGSKSHSSGAVSERFSSRFCGG